MFKKIINKIIMGTKCYMLLKERCNALEKENNDIREKTKIQLCEKIEILKDKDAYIDYLLKALSQNKTIARRIVRRVNGLIKREDSVQATKEVKALCNEIIKGE